MSKNDDLDVGDDDLDISEILAPPKDPQVSPIKNKTTENATECGKIEEGTIESFVHYYPHSKPLIENQPEYFSSEEERITVAAPRLPNLKEKKIAQKRMRLIILVDIVLFIVILGVIYPSLYKLQTRGKVGGYRFSIEQSRDAELLNILVKTERLLSSKSQDTQYQVHIFSDGEQIYEEQSKLPSLDSPVTYALFPLVEPSLEVQNFDIIIRVGQDEQKFFLSVEPDLKEE